VSSKEIDSGFVYELENPEDEWDKPWGVPEGELE
jgi:hypothetical protein